MAGIRMSNARIRTITVSSMLDSYINGVKRSTFVSAKVDLHVGSYEEFRLEHTKAGMEVAIAAVQNAMCRQEISETEARDRIGAIKENYAHFLKIFEERYALKIEEDQRKVEDFLREEPEDKTAT
jgi:hypothetical protein